MAHHLHAPFFKVLILNNYIKLKAVSLDVSTDLNGSNLFSPPPLSSYHYLIPHHHTPIRRFRDPRIGQLLRFPFFDLHSSRTQLCLLKNTVTIHFLCCTFSVVENEKYETDDGKRTKRSSYSYSDFCSCGETSRWS